jgi:hypothetical protein
MKKATIHLPLHQLRTSYLRYLLGAALLALSLLSACKRTAQQPSESADTIPSPVVAEPIEMNPHPSSYGLTLQATLRELMAKPRFEVMQDIKAIDLFSYLSAHYPSGHPFPVLFLDPAKHTLTVSHKAFQQEYPSNQLDKALVAYRAQLVEHGYMIDGVAKDNNKYVVVKGEKMVQMDLKDLFPDEGEAKSHFTAAQFDFIHNELNATAGFVYLSGLENTGHDYPLIVGTGSKETARLSVLGKGIAEEFRFEQLDAALASFKAHVLTRM